MVRTQETAAVADLLGASLLNSSRLWLLLTEAGAQQGFQVLRFLLHVLLSRTSNRSEITVVNVVVKARLVL